MKMFLAISSILFLLLSGSVAMVYESGESPSQQFLVITFGDNNGALVTQGTTSRSRFKSLFLDKYAIRGERHHPGENAFIWGQLIAKSENTVVNVPIWKWKLDDGSSRFLCQATDDGTPPAFSIFGESERELISQIKIALEQEYQKESERED